MFLLLNHLNNENKGFVYSEDHLYLDFSSLEIGFFKTSSILLFISSKLSPIPYVSVTASLGAIFNVKEDCLPIESFL